MTVLLSLERRRRLNRESWREDLWTPSQTPRFFGKRFVIPRKPVRTSPEYIIFPHVLMFFVFAFSLTAVTRNSRTCRTLQPEEKASQVDCMAIDHQKRFAAATRGISVGSHRSCVPNCVAGSGHCLVGIQPLCIFDRLCRSEMPQVGKNPFTNAPSTWN